MQQHAAIPRVDGQHVGTAVHDVQFHLNAYLRQLLNHNLAELYGTFGIYNGQRGAEAVRITRFFHQRFRFFQIELDIDGIVIVGRAGYTVLIGGLGIIAEQNG